MNPQGQMDFGFDGQNGNNGKHKKRGRTGKERKADGMESLSANNHVWMADADLVVRLSIPHGWRGLPEDWRPIVTDAIGEPTRHQAWGPLTARLIKSKFIHRTGNRRPMRWPTSNARMTDEYERS